MKNFSVLNGSKFWLVLKMVPTPHTHLNISPSQCTTFSVEIQIFSSNVWHGMWRGVAQKKFFYFARNALVLEHALRKLFRYMDIFHGFSSHIPWYDTLPRIAPPGLIAVFVMYLHLVSASGGLGSPMEPSTGSSILCYCKKMQLETTSSFVIDF